MKTNTMKTAIAPLLLLAGAVGFSVGCASTRPEPSVIGNARLAVQDARDAGAAELSADKLKAAEVDLAAAQREWNSGHDEMALHYGQLADSEAREAEFHSRGIKAQQQLEAERARHDRLDAEVRAAEQAAIEAKARSAAEKARMEAELRARQEQERLQAEMQAREAEQKAAEQRQQELQAQLDAERQRTEDLQKQQAQIDALKAQLEEQTKAADAARQAAEEQSAKLEEARKQEEARRVAAEQEAQKQQQAQQDLVARLQQLEKSTKVEARGIVVTLPGNIYFATNRSNLLPAVRKRLADIGKTLASAPDRHVIVEGHTDSTGSADYNLKLSELRAAAVKNVLVANGVTPDRIETQGYGETQPVADNSTEAGRSQNRRVEIVVQGPAAAPPSPPAEEEHN